MQIENCIIVCAITFAVRKEYCINLYDVDFLWYRSELILSQTREMWSLIRIHPRISNRWDQRSCCSQMAALVIRGIDWYRYMLSHPFTNHHNLVIMTFQAERKVTCVFLQQNLLTDNNFKRDKDRDSKNKSKFDIEIWDSAVNTNITVFFGCDYV
jgi:hypothetical protein